MADFLHNNNQLRKIAKLIAGSKYCVAFTGAGVSVESGVPPFRGEGGLWNRYDPQTLELGYFFEQPDKSWEVVREIFYSFFGKVDPNEAHLVLADWENRGLVKALITQNIDNLHQQSGSKEVFEFHGNAMRLLCVVCGAYVSIEEANLSLLPPRCKGCTGLLKPDFIFFGEGIPQLAYSKSVEAASQCDLMLIIGTAGEVSPANQIPIIAKNQGAVIVEINLEPSYYTEHITDYYLSGKAGEIMPQLDALIREGA
jgi:NAD-dependent deacetylase